MSAIKSESNQDADLETLSDSELIKRLNHIDELAHCTEQTVIRIEQAVLRMELFIDEHKPALARGLSLMDPGAGLRKFVTGKNKRG
jgi:hypothetical protein